MYDFMVYAIVASVLILVVFNLVKYPLEGFRKFVRGFFISEHVEELPSETVNGQRNEPIILIFRNSRKIMKAGARFFSWLGYFQNGEPANRFAKPGIDQEFKKEIKNVRIYRTSYRFQQPALEIYEKGDLTNWDLLKLLWNLMTKIFLWLILLIISGVIGGFIWWWFSKTAGIED